MGLNVKAFRRRYANVQLPHCNVMYGGPCMTKSYLWRSAFRGSLFCLPLLAHHGTSNYSTTAQTITLSGIVTEFVSSNPHVYVLFEVQDAMGNVVHWAGEMNSPGVPAIY
jgi:hypothetical protein